MSIKSTLVVLRLKEITTLSQPMLHSIIFSSETKRILMEMMMTETAMHTHRCRWMALEAEPMEVGLRLRLRICVVRYSYHRVVII
jgi:hypothetical protein